MLLFLHNICFKRRPGSVRLDVQRLTHPSESQKCLAHAIDEQASATSPNARFPSCGSVMSSIRPVHGAQYRRPMTVRRRQVFQRLKSIASTGIAVLCARLLSFGLFVFAARTMSQEDNAGLIYVIGMSQLVVQLGTLGWLNLIRRMAAKLDLDPDQIVLDKLDVTRTKYPVEKARGKSTKYDQLQD